MDPQHGLSRRVTEQEPRSRVELSGAVGDSAGKYVADLESRSHQQSIQQAKALGAQQPNAPIVLAWGENVVSELESVSSSDTSTRLWMCASDTRWLDGSGPTVASCQSDGGHQGSAGVTSTASPAVA